uniref:Retrovirus-related Pol polyprotein from transposon TNT 1-94 n=1 Tax=Tanacetum cinerariifolium TaxID=118510 RepID=A0A6L2LJQ6_TANCI|nr:retrovirus-related Pol polyprotein from transposon TNT 1-94 [Tanacetum cinerariifolium]
MEHSNTTPTKISILDTGKIEQWKFRIQQYLQNEHYALWEVIEFRDSYEAPKDGAATGSTSDGKKGRTIAVITKDMQKRRNDVKVRTTLLLALPDEHQLRFSKYKTTQELWAAILKTFGGNEATKKNKKNLLKQQYGNFKAEAKNNSGNREVNTADIPTASTQVSPAGSNIKYEDINQIDEDGIEEMDIKWNMALLSMRADRYWKKTGKKISIQGTDVAGFDKSKVECFNCHKMGHFARECRAPRSQEKGRKKNYRQDENHALVVDEEAPTEFALMAKSNTDNEVFDNSLCSKACKKNTDSLNTSKDLDNLLESQRSDKNKEGLGYSAVPLPPAQVYSPPKKDMSWTGLPEFADNTITDFNRPSPAIEKAKKPTETKTDKVETVRKTSVKYAEMYRKTSKRSNVKGNQRNWNNLKIQQLGKNFLMKNKACYDCGCFDHLSYDCECIVLGQNFKLTDDTNVLLRTPRQHNMYSIDINNVVPHKDLTCLVAKAYADECMLWHRRLGHLNIKTMNRFTWTFFLKTKDETSGIIRNFITEIENLKELKVKIIRCNNGGEFRNNEMNDFCSRKGIKREFNNDRTPQQNGVAERRNKTLIEAVRTMLADSKLPVTFWAEAVNTACYVQNRVLVNKSQNKTPYKLFNGRTPAIGFLKPFGCHVMILNTFDHLGKFEAKGDEGYFIGYSMSSKAFRVFNKRTKRVEENLHVDFLENKAIEKEAGLNWLFNIDSLTNSINYVPVVVADTNSTNFLGIKEAAGQDMKKDVSSLRYIALPNWFHEAHLESSTSNAQDACNADAPENSGNSNPTATSTNPLADHMETLTVETPIPTVSFPISIACLDDSSQLSKPKKISDALKDPSWVEAMQEELFQFKIQNVWSLVDCSKREEGIDYDEIFAHVARIEAIRLFLAYASFMGFTVYQMDVKSAFLYGTIDKEVYVMQPPKFQDPEFPARVYKVEKAMYGLHQAPRAWYGILSKYLLTNGFQRGTIDQTLFIKRQRGDFILVQVYVDDIIFGSSNPQLCREFEALMHEKFQMSAIGELNFFLDVRSAKTPMDKENPWGKDKTGKDVDLHLYRSMIRSLMYLTTSRPDIMFDVCAYARHQVTPKECHMHIVKRIFRYLKGHLKLGLWYPKESPFDLVAYSDSDYGGATQDRKSTTRGCQFLGRRLISWQCKKQTIIATSTTKAEYVAAASGSFCDYHNMIAIMEKYELNTDFHQIVDFVEASHLRQYTRRARIAQSSALPPIADKRASHIRDDSQGEACPTDSGLEVEQDWANITKTSTLPSDSTPRVTSLAADEGSMQQKLNELTDLCTRLQRQGRSLDEGEEASIERSTEKGSNDTEEMVNVLTSLDATTVLSSGVFVSISPVTEVSVAEVPTGSGSIPAASHPVTGVPTGSDVVPTSSPIFTTATVATPYTRRKVLWSHTGWKTKHFKGMTLEEIKKKFDLVWKQIQDFIPIGSKEKSERFKRKRIRLEQDSAKNVKILEEVSEEDLKAMMQLVLVKEVYVETLQVKHLIIDWEIQTEGQRSYWKIIRLGGSTTSYQFFVDMLNHFDREDLNQLWELVKETLNIRQAASDKEKELWVELKILYEPDVEDQLWTHTQTLMHDLVE